MMSPYFNFAYYKAAENYVTGKDGTDLKCTTPL
jgi:hypothetical protein